jgi:hypothetical protein
VTGGVARLPLGWAHLRDRKPRWRYSCCFALPDWLAFIVTQALWRCRLTYLPGRVTIMRRSDADAIDHALSEVGPGMRRFQLVVDHVTTGQGIRWLTRWAKLGPSPRVPRASPILAQSRAGCP